MPTRRNLATNPALKYDATGWFGPSGWARTDAASGMLPRQTGFTGTAAGNLSTSHVLDVVAGLPYVVSWSIRSFSLNEGDAGIDWYDAAGWIAGDSVPFSVNAAAARVEVGPFVAPAGTTRLAVAIAGIDSQAQITALLIEQTDTAGGSYFDGDTVGASWDGVNGNSASTLVTAGDTPQSAAAAFGFADAGAVTIGPAGTDTARLSALGAVEAAIEQAPDSAAFTESALAVMLGYDAVRGRVRLDARGFAPGVTRAVIEARAAGAQRFEPIRGGQVAVIGGRLARPVDHYEFAAGVRTTYRVQGYATPPETAAAPVQTALVDRVDELEQVWLKFIAAPYLNLPVTLTDWDDIERTSRNSAFEVKGRRETVVVTDVHSSRRTAVQFLTRDAVEREQLDHALSQGMPLFLHVPPSCPLPTMYAAPGTYRWRRTSRRTQRALFTVEITEVAAPPLSVVGAAVTWQSVLDLYPTWQDLLDEYPTWQAVLA